MAKLLTPSLIVSLVGDGKQKETQEEEEEEEGGMVNVKYKVYDKLC